MRFGNWRGAPLALTLAVMLGMGLAASVRADGWHLSYTIPREVPAYDYTTGGEYYAPPIPYGHYVKDKVGIAMAVGCASGYASQLHGCLKDMWDKSVGLFHGCGDGCGHGCGHGNGCGNGSGTGCGLGHCGSGLGSGGNGCGFCSGMGLFHHGDGSFGNGCGTTTAVAGMGLGGVSTLNSGIGHKKHFAPCHASTVATSSQAYAVGQTMVSPTGQSLCGSPGCKIGGRHSHLGNLLCRFCGGSGCRGCGGAGSGDPCSACGGLGHGGNGSLCGGCGGCGLFGHGSGHGGAGCALCGGKGCANCLQGLGTKAHGVLGHLTGSISGLLHHNNFDYFVGPGGPVPLTPGYVPYVVTTRSPRDFFAFPPMNPNDP